MGTDALQLLLNSRGIETPPPVLYHYTSADALLSIVNSERMYATHIKYLNDISETAWMWSVVLKRLEARKNSAKSVTEAALLSELIRTASNPRQLNEFVASFSEKGDDLSQWRAYCPIGGGYSIGFAAPALRTQWVFDPAGGESSFVGGCLAKVKYLDEKDTSQIDLQIDVVSRIAGISRNSGTSWPHNAKRLHTGMVSVMAPSHKHPAFSSNQGSGRARRSQ